VASSIHLLNISPTKTMRNMTPFEAWWKRKLNVICLKNFSCVAYALVASGDRTKNWLRRVKNASLLDIVMKQRVTGCIILYSRSLSFVEILFFMRTMIESKKKIFSMYLVQKMSPC